MRDRLVKTSSPRFYSFCLPFAKHMRNNSIPVNDHLIIAASSFRERHWHTGPGVIHALPTAIKSAFVKEHRTIIVTILTS